MRDLSVVLAQFIGDFSSRKSAKMVKFSTDKHAQPNFVRDSCVYANFGQCDWALKIRDKGVVIIYAGQGSYNHLHWAGVL